MANESNLFPTAQKELGYTGTAQALNQVIDTTKGGGGSLAYDLSQGANIGAMSPATQQLIEEAMLIQAGKKQAAIDSSQRYVSGTSGGTSDGTTDSSTAQGVFDDLINQMGTYTGGTGASGSSSSSFSYTGVGDVDQPEFEMPNTADIDQLIQLKQNNVQANLFDQINAIKDQFNFRKEAQQDVNKQREGGTRAFLGRAGALRSASGQGAITAEIQRGQAAMRELEMIERQAIQAAESAAMNADIELLSQSIQAAEKARAARNEIRQQEFENTMAAGSFTLEAMQAQQQNDFKKAQFVLDQLTGLSPDALAGVDLSYLSDVAGRLGLPSTYFQDWKKTQQELAEADSAQAAYDKSVELFKLALDLPEGMSAVIGDNVIKGLKIGANDNKIFQVEDDAGNINFLTFDRNGALINSFDAGPIGKATQASVSGGSGGSGSTSTKIPQSVMDALNEGLPLIGKVTPATYDPKTGKQLTPAKTITTRDVISRVMALPEAVNNPDVTEFILDTGTSIDKYYVPGSSISTQVSKDKNDNLLWITGDEQSGKLLDVKPVLIEGQETFQQAPGLYDQFLNFSQKAGEKFGDFLNF